MNTRKTFGQIGGEIGNKVSEAQADLPELNKLKDIVLNHRVNVLIEWAKKGVKRDQIKEYMELSWESYSLCDPKSCNAGSGCCHQFKAVGIKFCSPY